jgi:hypothetical protein
MKYTDADLANVRGGPEALLQLSLAQLTGDLSKLALQGEALEDALIAELQSRRTETGFTLPEATPEETMKALISHAAGAPAEGRETSSSGAPRETPEVSQMTVELMLDEMTGMSGGDHVTFSADEVGDFHVLVCGVRMPRVFFDLHKIKYCATLTSNSSFQQAGCSGIAMGIKLGMAGIPYTIIERSDDFGGTWHANQYPDAGCDVPSHFYSYSFEPNANWSGYYSKAAEIRDYFKSVALKYGIEKNTR